MRLDLTLPRLLSVLLLALLGGIVAFWAVTLTAPRMSIAPASASAPAVSVRDFSSIAPLFGALPTQTVASPVDGLRVNGLVTGQGAGLALIAAEGKPARAYSVGDTVAPGLTLGEMGTESITLIRQGSGERLTLPAPARTSTAVLTAGPVAGSTSPSTPPMPAPGAAPMPATMPSTEPPAPPVEGAVPPHSTAPGSVVPSSVAPGYFLPIMPRATR